MNPKQGQTYLGDMLPLLVPSSAGPPGPMIPALAGPLLAERSAYQLPPPPLLRDRSKAREPVLEFVKNHRFLKRKTLYVNSFQFPKNVNLPLPPPNGLTPSPLPISLEPTPLPPFDPLPPIPGSSSKGSSLR